MRSDLGDVRKWLTQGASEKEMQERALRKKIAQLADEADVLARDCAAMRQAAMVIEQVMGPTTTAYNAPPQFVPGGMNVGMDATLKRPSDLASGLMGGRNIGNFGAPMPWSGQPVPDAPDEAEGGDRG